MKKEGQSRFFLYVCVFVVGVIIFLMSPIFNIRAININNNNVVTDTQIINSIGDTTNILAFSKRNARNSLLSNPYIEAVDIRKDYINREVNIDITEREVIGYIQFSEHQFLYIDKKGMVLEVNSFFTEPLPIVVGLNFSEFTIGEVLELDNEDAFYIVYTLAYLFEKYNIKQDIIRVDVSDAYNIMLYYGQIQINIGTIDDIDKKIRVVKTILPKISPMKYIGGTLNVKYIDRPWVFELLI